MGLDAQDKLKLEEVQAVFPRMSDPPELQKLGAAGVSLARLILETCAATRERDRALDHVADALLFARAAIDAWMAGIVSADLTVFRTPAPGCPACKFQMRHSAEEWKLYHPYAGHGYRKGTGWSAPELKPPDEH